MNCLYFFLILSISLQIKAGYKEQESFHFADVPLEQLTPEKLIIWESNDKIIRLIGFVRGYKFLFSAQKNADICLLQKTVHSAPHLPLVNNTYPLDSATFETLLKKSIPEIVRQESMIHFFAWKKDLKEVTYKS